jgi:hypothetical protein
VTFEEAVRSASAPVSGAYRKGKQAIAGEHREQIRCSDTRRLTGSVDLDAALGEVAEFRDANRWDYGLGFREKAGHEVAVWVEVHPANPGEVRVVLRKLQWLKDWLSDGAAGLALLSQRESANGHFHWLATDTGTSIPPTSREARLLAQQGLRIPRRTLTLE